MKAKFINEIKRNKGGSGLGAIGIGRIQLVRNFFEEAKGIMPISIDADGKLTTTQLYIQVFSNRSNSVMHAIPVDCALANIEELPSYIDFGYCKNFYLQRLRKLKTLNGFPKKVEYIYLKTLPSLISLEHFPYNEHATTSISYCKNLKNLEGLPKTKNTNLNIEHNAGLISLHGCPDSVRHFHIEYTPIKNFIGGPKYVHDSYTCRFNKNLNSLDGFPTHVGGNLYFSNNLYQATEEEIRSICNVGGNVNIKNIN